MNSNTIKLVVAIVALGVAAVLIGKQLMAPGNEGEGANTLSHWLCINSDCGASFDLTLGQLAKSDDGPGDGGPQCPDCSKRMTVRANICQHCSKAYELGPHATVPEKCPSCDEPLY